MCGLAAAFKKKQKKHTGSQIINLYDEQAHRGKNGFGYIAIKGGRIKAVHRAKDEKSIRYLLGKEKADHILFHHRLPTSTKNTLGTTHPIFVSHPELKYDYFFAHNGIISNALELKKLHESLGYSYTTEFTEKTVAHYKDGHQETLESETSVFNDSESLAIELARFIENITDKVGTTGAAAFWGVSFEKGGNLVNEVYFGKNLGRELCIKETGKFITVASETGEDIRDMVLFSMKLDEKFTMTERELVIDKSFKKTTTTQSSATHSSWFRSAENDYVPKTIKERMIYTVLPNALFTWLESEQVGLPREAWLHVSSNPVLLYVPRKFAGVDTNSRGRLTDKQLADVKNVTENYTALYGDDTAPLELPGTTQIREAEAVEEDPKIVYEPELMNKLEELAFKYAELQSELTFIDSAYEEGKIPERLRDIRATAIEKSCNELEEKMYTMGIDEATVGETVETAISIQDYGDSYLTEEQRMADLAQSISDASDNHDDVDEEAYHQTRIGFHRHAF